MLTDLQLKKARGTEKDYKLAEGGGLHVLVSPTGNRSWRLKYRFGKKEKLLTIGTYPETSLKEARSHWHVVRSRLASRLSLEVQLTTWSTIGRLPHRSGALGVLVRPLRGWC